MNVKYLKVIIFGLAMGFLVYTKLDTPTSNHTSAFEGFSYERSAFSHKTKVEVDHDIEYVRDLLDSCGYAKYTNSRFGFSVKYPDCFVKGEEPLNGDGCGFSMKYGISFSVWGIYNINDKTIQEYYKNDPDLPAATYHIQKENWFVMSGNTKDNKIFYKKVVLMQGDTEEGTYVTFYLLFPKKFKDVLADFIKYEARNFNPKFEGTDNSHLQEEELYDPLNNLQIEEESQQNIKQNGLTRDQQIALMLLMIAASSESSDDDGGHRSKCICGTCGLSFENSGDLRSHQNAIHDY